MKQTSGSVGARYESLASDGEGATGGAYRRHGLASGWQMAFLMAFVNPALSVYQIRRRHCNEEVRELIPADFGGVLACDRGRSYDAVELEQVAEQKCLAHLIRNAAQVVVEYKTGRACHFGRQLIGMLRR
jgi:transposase